MKRDHHFFDEWARRNQMIPQYVVETDEGRVLIADSDDVIVDGEKMYYRTGYAIDRGGLEIGNYHDYDHLEMSSLTPRSAQQARMDEAVFHARHILSQTVEAGLYDNDGRFSNKPN